MYNICIKVYIDRENCASDERKKEKEENVLYYTLN